MPLTEMRTQTTWNTWHSATTFVSQIISKNAARTSCPDSSRQDRENVTKSSLAVGGWGVSRACRRLGWRLERRESPLGSYRRILCAEKKYFLSTLRPTRSRRTTGAWLMPGKWNFWPLQNFWPIIVCQLFCFSEWRNKIWRLLSWCVLCELGLFGYTPDTHNKLQYGNNYSITTEKYSTWSNSRPKPKPTHLNTQP